MSASTPSMRRVNASGLNDPLGLMRAYRDFHKASPADEELLAGRELGDHDREGVQLLARDVEGRAVAFATCTGAGPRPARAASE